MIGMWVLKQKNLRQTCGPNSRCIRTIEFNKNETNQQTKQTRQNRIKPINKFKPNEEACSL